MKSNSMNLLLEGRGLPKSTKIKTFVLSAFILFATAFSANAQTKVTGKVTNSDGEPLIGANVLVEGTSVGAVTGLDGVYEINTLEAGDILVFSYPEYKSKSVAVISSSVVDVILERKFDDNIDTGLGAVSKEESSSSSSHIDGDKINSSLTNLEQANQGTTAGLFVQNSSGKLGQGTTVRIRGGSSLSASNQPLYVVDGVPLKSGSQSNINPTNIASMEVLKDASATAIYGSRAANGVIIITTKSGNTGQTQVNLDYHFGVNQTPKYLEMMSRDEYAFLFAESSVKQIVKGIEGIPGNTVISNNINRKFIEGVKNGSINQIDFTLNGNSQSVPLPSVLRKFTDKKYNTDWQNEIFQTALTHTANADVQGGTDALSYFASVGYNNQEGILIGNKFQKFNGTVSLNSKMSERLSGHLSFNYIYTKDNQINEDSDLGNPMQLLANPTGDTYDPKNNYRNIIRTTDYSALTEFHYADNIAFGQSILGSLGLKYKITDKLSFDIKSGLDLSNFRHERRQGPETADGSVTGKSRLSKDVIQNYVGESWFTYNTKFNDIHKISGIVGVSYQQDQGKYKYREARVNGINLLENLNKEDATLREFPIPGTASKIASSYFRLNYDYHKYFDIQLSGRVDASSKFSKENRYGFFPAASVGVKIHEMMDAPKVNSLKFRMSWGQVGNTPEEDFLSKQILIQSKYNNLIAYEPSNIANNSIKWETTTQYDVGLDYEFLDGRLYGSVDLYLKNTVDLLFPKSVSPTSGFSSILDNFGSLENKGVEVSLGGVIIDQEDFSWSADFNISANRNVIKELNESDSISVFGENAYLKGHPTGVLYMRKYLDYDPLTGKSFYDDGKGGKTTDYKLAPRMVVGNPNPDFFGGFSNTFTYKNFELNFLFQFVQGVDVYFKTGELIANSGYGVYNQLKTQHDRWVAPGDLSKKYPELPNIETSSSRWIQDGSYIRLKNVRLTYNFNIKGLRSLSMYISGTNLYTFTDYIGYDPDVSSSGDDNSGTFAQNITKGIDNFTAPQPRIFVTGVKIGF